MQKIGTRHEAHYREPDYFKGGWWAACFYAMLGWRAPATVERTGHDHVRWPHVP